MSTLIKTLDIESWSREGLILAYFPMFTKHDARNLGLSELFWSSMPPFNHSALCPFPLTSSPLSKGDFPSQTQVTAEASARSRLSLLAIKETGSQHSLTWKSFTRAAKSSLDCGAIILVSKSCLTSLNKESGLLTITFLGKQETMSVGIFKM